MKFSLSLVKFRIGSNFYYTNFKRSYELQHCEKDLLQLVEKIHRLNDEVRVVMESTGAYHYPILIFLKQHGIFVSVVNAYLMKKYSLIAIKILLDFY